MLELDAHRYGLQQTTGPAAVAVSLSDAKNWLRVTNSDDDTLIAALVERATQFVENETRRQLINATWVMKLDTFPHGSFIDFPVSPLVSVTSIEYLDGDGASQTLPSFFPPVYGVDTTQDPGRIFLKSGQEWPSTLDEANAVTVTAVAGYGTAASDIPAALVHAVLMLVAHFYEHREAVDPRGGQFGEVPLGVSNLIHQYRVARAY